MAEIISERKRLNLKPRSVEGVKAAETARATSKVYIGEYNVVD